MLIIRGQVHTTVKSDVPVGLDGDAAGNVEEARR